jgi:hypothetical protein
VTERKIRHLINTRAIEHVWIGSRVHVPMGAFARFIETNKITPCQDETRDTSPLATFVRERTIAYWVMPEMTG